MRILITGSSGYLGTKAASLLKDKGRNELFGIDVNAPRNEWAYADFVKASVTDEAAMRGLFDKASPDAAVHLAFVVNSLHDEGKEEEVALKGTELFLSNCERHKVKKIIFMSSAAAYGAHPKSEIPYKETSPINGNEGYAYSRLKAVTDRMASLFMNNYKDGAVVILRPCLFVGPHTDNAFFEVLKFPFFPQISDESGLCDPFFQFIHEDDMAACLVSAIQKDVNGIYNVAADGLMKLSELADVGGKRRVAMPVWMINFFTSFLWKMRLIGSPPGQLDFMRYSWIMDNSKMKAGLFSPRYSSREAFEIFIKSRKS